MTSTVRSFLAVVCALALAGSAPAAARQTAKPSGGKGTVSGVLRDRDGSPIGGATVTLDGLEPGTKVECETDRLGQYSFEAGAGPYHLVFMNEGLVAAMIDDGVVRAGEVSRRDVTVDMVSIRADALGNGITIVWPAEDLVLHAAERKAASADGRATFGATELMLSVKYEDRVRELLAAGADVNAKDDFGVTALMHVALYNVPRTVEMLLAAGADVDAADRDGLTALMVAAFAGNGSAVEALLRAGAYAPARDSRGKTALDYARENGRERVVKALEAAVAGE